MRYLPLIGTYANAGKKLKSGVSYSTQPSEIPIGGLAVEEGRVYEFARISGTCCCGMLLYYTGTDMGYVCGAGTSLRPAGVSLVSPTASGDWTFIQKFGRNTTIHVSSTFGINQASAAAWGSMYALGASGVWNHSAAITNVGIGSGAQTGGYQLIGQMLSDVVGSAGLGFINLL